MILARDSEEFMITTYKNSNKKVFSAIIKETSNMVFEWPYIGYVRNQKDIFIHSVNEERSLSS